MSLQPVEYYNNLPQPKRGAKAAASLAILVDPVIATGGTAAAAIQTLKVCFMDALHYPPRTLTMKQEWGVDKIILISVLGAAPGIRKAAEEWPEGTELFVGGLDPGLTDKGMINPGLGDIGDRLFLTLGK
jgi:uracil phosphoribosyltransferase